MQYSKSYVVDESISLEIVVSFDNAITTEASNRKGRRDEARLDEREHENDAERHSGESKYIGGSILERK